MVNNFNRNGKNLLDVIDVDDKNQAQQRESVKNSLSPIICMTIVAFVTIMLMIEVQFLIYVLMGVELKASNEAKGKGFFGKINDWALSVLRDNQQHSILHGWPLFC